MCMCAGMIPAFLMDRAGAGLFELQKRDLEKFSLSKT